MLNFLNIEIHALFYLNSKVIHIEKCSTCISIAHKDYYFRANVILIKILNNFIDYVIY
ncbi:hypothetical protein MAR621_03474 [Maribacter dokdonensis]|nr:hypothetical protein MAR621_03474 [Maribacter dokdonensis]